MKFLLLEDDIDYRDSIKDYLESLEYKVDAYDNGEDALNAIYENSYQILILDIRVPKLNGYELVEYIKKDNIQTPVIYITSLTDINNLSLGYELGCTDYIKKPFSPKELKYRIENIIKLYYANNNTNIQINQNTNYNIIKKNLYINNKEISFTKKESELVFCLITNKNQFLDLDQLRYLVWEDKYISEVDIRVCIKNIRDKTYKDFIINQRSVGYKIVREE